MRCHFWWILSEQRYHYIIYSYIQKYIILHNMYHKRNKLKLEVKIYQNIGATKVILQGKDDQKKMKKNWWQTNMFRYRTLKIVNENYGKCSINPCLSWFNTSLWGWIHCSFFLQEIDCVPRYIFFSKSVN